MTPAEAEKYGIKDNDIVDVEIQNSKPTRFYNVQVRVREDFNTEMHIDTDDANACAIKTGDRVVILENNHIRLLSNKRIDNNDYWQSIWKRCINS